MKMIFFNNDTSMGQRKILSYSLGDLYIDKSKNILKTLLYGNVSSDSDGVVDDN